MSLFGGLSPQDLREIEIAVEQAELSTSGEIVPVLVKQSSDRAYLPALTMVLGLAVAVAIHLLNSTWGKYPEFNLYMLLCFFTLSGFGVGWIPFVQRFILGKAKLMSRVHEKACATFLMEGLTETQDRTGVLIFISLFERSVEIIGDKGIHSKLPEGAWDKSCKRLAKEIADGHLKTGLIQTIQEISALLKLHFPRKSDDQNELGNPLRLRE